MEVTQLSDEELLKALNQAAQENQLLIWWEQCYGSPANPEPDWQRRFYDAGSFASQRLVMAANGVGKSMTVCAELAAHCIGEYPDWWKGKRFTRAGWEVWVGSIDNNMQKRGPQRALLGRDLEQFLGTGLIPGSRIVGKPETRQAGVKEVADSVVVRHSSGDNVIIKFLTFEQGWRKWQSGDPKIILWDEEPDDSISDQKDILSEALTRLVRNNGIFIGGYTPLLGDTQLTEHFMHSEDPSVWWIGATWDDAPHMDLEARKRIEMQYPEHQRAARTQGIPMLGEGRIFSKSETSFCIDPIKIPNHWARIAGIDFGGTDNHPHAAAWLAWDRDQDIVYITDIWRQTAKVSEHAHAINARGDWIPVAWPHDGMQHDPRSGQRMYEIYRREHRVSMLSKSARYKSAEGGPQPQWPIIEDFRNRLDTGKLKVFRTCTPWIEEYRSYHMKDRKIVAKRDDALKASFYAAMMLRYAVSVTEGMRESRSTQGAPFRTAVK